MLSRALWSLTLLKCYLMSSLTERTHTPLAIPPALSSAYSHTASTPWVLGIPSQMSDVRFTEGLHCGPYPRRLLLGHART
ncbi:hypothetical protein BJY52DRAFT_1321676 [Lactarius psammicola]|nr:hypothetical protein BJY52DRAFT_1321676 [Lactarius psammicola]